MFINLQICTFEMLQLQDSMEVVSTAQKVEGIANARFFIKPEA